MEKHLRIGIGVGIGLLVLALTYSVSAHMGGFEYGHGFPMMGYGMMGGGFAPEFNTPDETEGPSLPSWTPGFWGYQGYQSDGFEGGYGRGYDYGYGMGYGHCPMMGW